MLGFASLITLGIIFGFIFVVLLLAANFLGYADMSFVILGTIIINILSWLISPFFMDLMFRWLYKTRRLELSDLEQKSKPLADFVKNLCEKHKMKLPRLRLIEDDNPTAFAFGSGVYNARLCFSEGLFTYLHEDERQAVIAHELGHIRRRDFIIMTIAATAVQILYELAQMILRRSHRSDDRKGGGLAIVALLTYIFYFIATYLLLFLSRTREYGADEFSAHETQNPDALSRALVKIAYGIVAKPDDEGQQRLLNATRPLGPFDPTSARNLGTVFEMSGQNPAAVTKVLAFDFLSPWAKIMQLQSTHPLTGRRIQRLNSQAKKLGKPTTFDTDAAEKIPVDHSRMYGGFLTGVIVHFLPWLLPLCVMAAAAISQNSYLLVWIPASLGVAYLLKILYKYPQGSPQKTTTLEMLQDLYASPVRGNLYELEGTVIGRGIAGSKLSEDLMMKDSAGLIYLNYESAFSFIGNLFFAIGKVRKLIGQKAQAVGWFFRDIGHHLDLHTMKSEGETINSYPRLWATVFAFVLIAVSLYASQKFTTGAPFGSLFVP